MTVSVLTTDAYDPSEYDGVLVKERTVVLLDADDDRVRTVPLSNVVYVDGDVDERVPGRDVSDHFYGGCEYAFLDPEEFPEAL